MYTHFDGLQLCRTDRGSVASRFARPGRTYKWGASRVGIGGVIDCSNLITSPDPTLSSAHSQMRAAAATWARMPHKTDASGIHRLISECPPLDQIGRAHV